MTVSLLLRKVLMASLLEKAAALGVDSAEYRSLRSVAETFFPTEFRPAPTSLPFVRRNDAPQSWSTAAAPLRAMNPINTMLPTPSYGLR